MKQRAAWHTKSDLLEGKGGVGIRLFILHSSQLVKGHGEPCPKTDQKRNVAVAVT